MKKDSSRKALLRNLIRQYAIQSVLTILIMIAAFCLETLCAQFFFHASSLWLLWGAGLIFPMTVFLIIINRINYHISGKKYSTLLQGITQIANGDYSVRLDTSRAGFLSPVYADFNKMAAELQNNSMLRKDFINSYSHEFKTPVVAINGFANLMLEQPVSQEEQKQYLQIIADESSRLAELANSTLMLSRLDAQQIVTDKKNYPLDEQLRKCAIMLSSAWEAKHITLSGDFSELTYNGNEELMQQLWLNLLNNAVKYTPDHGEIQVSLACENKMAVVKIADSGIGMDSETAAHIFDKYYQGDTKQKNSGLGLGLAIAHRITELCKGTISVQSRKDEGSTFTVKLPL